MQCSGPSDEEEIVAGYEQDDYYFQYGDQSKVDASVLTCDESAIQWHLSLSHTSLKSIKSLFPL